jgi:Trehalose utilisation
MPTTSIVVLLLITLSFAHFSQAQAQTPLPTQTQLKKILVLNKSQGGTGMYLESRRDMLRALNELALTHGFAIDSIGQNDGEEKTAEAFSASNLTQYQAVLCACYDDGNAFLDSTSQTNVENYVYQGGTLVAIFAASGFVWNWPWYTTSLVQIFYGPAGNNQPRVDLVHDSEGITEGSETSRIFEGLTAPKQFLDMFISFKASPRDTPGVTILVTIDESTSTKTIDAPMGADHPVVWVKSVGKGKVIHNSLGHSWSTSNVYTQADGYLTKLTWGLLRYAAGDFKASVACVSRPSREAHSSRAAAAKINRLSITPISTAEEIFSVEFKDAMGRAVRAQLDERPLQPQILITIP